MKAEFLKSASNSSHWPKDSKDEFCFIGRSNVGKSSLINAICKTKISRVSKTPGRTQLVNFFNYDNYRLVDLPGYGYAKVSQQKSFELADIIDEYILQRSNIKGIFQLCDINVITPLDIETAKFISSKFKNHFIIFNKTDKVNKSYVHNNMRKIKINFPTIAESNMIFVSVKNNINIDQIFKKIKFVRS